MQITKKAVDLTDLAIGVVVLGIVVSIGGYILSTYTASKLTDLSTVTTTNESVTFTGNNYQLSNTWVKSVTSVVNASTGQTVAAGNYTISISSVDGSATLTNLTSTWQGWKINYVYYNTSSRSDYVVANQSVTGLGEYGNWFKIIVIVGVAAIVLSLIFMAFGRGNTSAGGSY